MDHRLHLLNVHAEGEIGRVVLAGLPDLPGSTLLDKLRLLNEGDHWLKRFCTAEPRGFAQMSTNLVLPPVEAGAHAGFIVLQPDGPHAMSGSNAICVTTALLAEGRVPVVEPETALVLDTAAGLVEVRARCRQGACESVRLAMPWSYAEALDLDLDVPGLGRVRLDIAFGGVFYALVDPAPLGLRILPENARALAVAGMRILEAVRAAWTPEHPLRPGIKGLAYLMFCGEDEAGMRNATVMPPGRIDRSPCGTGSSARLAVLRARNGAQTGFAAAFRSIIGTRFETRILDEGEVAGRPAVRPEIAGRGFLFGREEIWLQAGDPLGLGHRPSDCW